MARQTLQEIRPSIDVRAAQNSIRPWPFTSNIVEMDDPIHSHSPLAPHPPLPDVEPARRRLKFTRICRPLFGSASLPSGHVRTLISPFPIPPTESSSPAVPFPRWSSARCQGINPERAAAPCWRKNKSDLGDRLLLPQSPFCRLGSVMSPPYPSRESPSHTS